MVAAHRTSPAKVKRLSVPNAARRNATGALTRLRQDITTIVREERERWQLELKRLRVTLRKVTEDRQVLPAPSCASSFPAQQDSTGHYCHLAEVHERLSRETAALACRLELQRAGMEEELAAASRQMEELHTGLEQRVERQHEALEVEVKELRSMMDAVWHSAARQVDAPAAETMLSGGCLHADFKAFMGNNSHEDSQDIMTLYEMVREALAETVNYQQQLDMEVEERHRIESEVAGQLDIVDLRLNVIQSIVRSVCTGYSQRMASSMGVPTPLPSLQQLADEDSRWQRLLEDASGLFHPSDIIDSSYRVYLADVLAVMEKCSCTFKEAIATCPKQLGGPGDHPEYASTCIDETTLSRDESSLRSLGELASEDNKVVDGFWTIG